MSNDDTKGTTATIIYSSSNNKRNNALLVIIFWIAVSIILTVFLIRDLIWDPGFIYSRDFVLPTDLSLTYSDLTDTWDNLHSHRNLELNKIPLFALLSAIDQLIGSENTSKLFLGTVIFSVLFVIFISLLLVFKEKVKSNIKLIAICAPPALLYLFNPWVADRISNHIFMVLGMALTPLMIIIYVSLLNRGERNYLKIFSASLLLAGISVVSTHNIFHVIPILIFITAYYIIVASNNKRKKMLLSSVLFFSFYIGLSSYWIVPIAYESATTSIEPRYDFSIEEIERLSGLNSFTNVVQMIGGGGWDLPLMFQNQNSYYLGFLIPIISLFAIGFFPSNKFIILLAIMLVCFLVLALGTNSPLPYLALSTPFSNVMWLFRDPSRLIQFIVLIYSIFLAFTIYRITFAKKKLSKVISVVLISLILVSVITSFSTYTIVNSAGGRFAPSMLPAALTDLRSFLDNDTGNYKVLWLPLRGYLYYDWNKVNDEIAGNVYVQSTPKATYDVSSTQASRESNFLRDLYSNSFIRAKTEKLGQILNIYGIKYVVVFTDLVLQGEQFEAQRIISTMNRQQDMNLVNQFGPYYVYRNSAFDSDNNAQFYASTMSAAQFYASTMSAAISNYTTVFEFEDFLAKLRTDAEESPHPDLEVIHQSPTHYLLRVNSTTPFLLIFTETYDPLWKIKIDSSTSASPIRAYYVLNGFVIDEPGQHMIEIEYTPQTWFNMGVVISVITMLVFVGYAMIYMFKRKPSLQAIGAGTSSAILTETFAYGHLLARLRGIKRYFSKKKS
jgi:hypothetical protein